MAGIRRADDVDAALTTHHFTVFAHTLDARPDFHFRSLQQPIRPPTTRCSYPKGRFRQSMSGRSPTPEKWIADSTHVLTKIASNRHPFFRTCQNGGSCEACTPSAGRFFLSFQAFTFLFRIPHRNTRQTATITSMLFDRAVATASPCDSDVGDGEVLASVAGSASPTELL